VSAAPVSGYPQRPCSTCNGRRWQQRTRPPVGAWECTACAEALAARYPGKRVRTVLTAEDMAFDVEGIGGYFKLVRAVTAEKDKGCWAVQRCAACPLPRCTLEMTLAEVGALRVLVNGRRNAVLAAMDAGRPAQEWRLGAEDCSPV
jgi:hypothetical protein